MHSNERSRHIETKYYGRIQQSAALFDFLRGRIFNNRAHFCIATKDHLTSKQSINANFTIRRTFRFLRGRIFNNRAQFLLKFNGRIVNNPADCTINCFNVQLPSRRPIIRKEQKSYRSLVEFVHLYYVATRFPISRCLF